MIGARRAGAKLRVLAALVMMLVVAAVPALGRGHHSGAAHHAHGHAHRHAHRHAAAAPKPDPDKIAATTTLSLSFASLDERIKCPVAGGGGGRVEHLYLTIKNDGTKPFSVSSVELLAPSDLGICPDVRNETGAFDKSRGLVSFPGLTIGPGRTAVLPLPIGTRDAPRPGTVPLLVRMRTVALANGAMVEDKQISGDKVVLEVPGLSDALKLFGAPTLLLLPGVILLGAIRLRYDDKGQKPWLAANSISFWIVAVIISLVIALPYGAIMQATGSQHNLIDRYDLADLWRISAFAIVVGLLAGCKMQKNADAAADRLKELTPMESDSPLKLASRLQALGVAVTNDIYDWGGNAGFRISCKPLEADWLMPQMNWTAPEPKDVKDDPEKSKQWKQAQSSFEAIGAQSTLDATKLHDLLVALPGAALEGIEWANGTNPREVSGAQEPKRTGEDVFTTI